MSAPNYSAPRISATPGATDLRATLVPQASEGRTASPPPPLAGEGREGARGLSAFTSGEGAKKPSWQVSAKMRGRARNLRQDQTPAERIIWYALRAHRLGGAGFRRQTPIGPYIVDFVSYTKKLVIEIDGGQHFDAPQQARDAKRDAFLTSRGFRVLRFSNHDVKTNRAGVLEVIAAALESDTNVTARGESAAPSLPSPASGGGGAQGTRGEYRVHNVGGTDNASNGSADGPGEGMLR